MTSIVNYNCHKECADICMEKYCGNLATEFYPIKIGDHTYLLPVCEKHYSKILEAEDEKNGKN